ncbi:zinc finger protein 391-like [Lingula anatina]|uniref:Zinc finger protein 391-like n=1 Tax=Lingula anatina TaxID=7574 RepID=A0A1S3HB75_LINAN|nr:zinc finger protein 391-like [Lingula anatina]|eukprot:XP_013383287.1 zinc finger protein 391-like [Lingula anatina]
MEQKGKLCDCKGSEHLRCRNGLLVTEVTLEKSPGSNNRCLMQEGPWFAIKSEKLEGLGNGTDLCEERFLMPEGVPVCISNDTALPDDPCAESNSQSVTMKRDICDAFYHVNQLVPTELQSSMVKTESCESYSLYTLDIHPSSSGNSCNVTREQIHNSMKKDTVEQGIETEIFTLDLTTGMITPCNDDSERAENFKESCNLDKNTGTDMKGSLCVVNCSEKQDQCSHLGIKNCTKVSFAADNDTKATLASNQILNKTSTSQFKCRFCSKQYKMSGHRNRHERTHSGEKPYKCDMCPMSFARKDIFRVHQMRHAQVFKEGCTRPRVPCPLCSKDFRDKRDLMRHMQAHTDAKPFKCSFCEKYYKGKNECQRHERMHKGEENFQKGTFLKHICDYCGKVFFRKDSYVRHLRIHTGEKPYRCDICDVAFSRRDLVALHLKEHKEGKMFKCKSCHRLFSDKDACNKHESCHLVEKSHPCQFCGNLFKHKHACKYHERQNCRMIKAHQCKFCSKGFSTKSTCKRHETSLHVTEDKVS